MSDVLEQEKLRKINIHTGPIEAVSQRMSFGNMDDFMQQKREQQAENGPIIEDPSEEQVIEAHKDVGLSLKPGSKKHPRRVKRAGEKRHLQRELLEKSQDTVQDTMPKEEVREHFAHFDVARLLFAKDKKNIYETLVDHYDEIKMELSRIEEYENQLLASDQEITDEEKAKLATLKDVKAFYMLHERLMTNKYYVMLPHAEMHKIPYDELRKRLDSLYNDTNKNEELINYYQDLIRLQQLGISDTKSISARQKEYLDQFQLQSKKNAGEAPDAEKSKDPVKEMKKIQAAYAALKKSLGGKSLSFAGKENRLLKTFYKIYGKDLEEYQNQLTEKQLNAKAKFTLAAILDEYNTRYKGKIEVQVDETADDKVEKILREAEDKGDVISEDDGQGVEGIALSKEQEESARQVDKMLFDKALSDGQVAFSTTLFNIKTEERLLVYYMVENGKSAQTLSGDDFFTVMKNYVPNPAILEKKAEWAGLSEALRSYKPAFNDIIELGRLDQESNQATAAVQNDIQTREDRLIEFSSKAEQRQAALKEAIEKKVALVSMLYRKAGMPPSMPPDMAKDPVLRQRLVSECQSILEMGASMDVLVKAQQQAEAAQKAQKEKNPTKGSVAREALEQSIAGEVGMGTFMTADQLVGSTMLAGTAFKNTAMGTAFLSKAYQGYSNMHDGLFSILGFLATIGTAVTVAKDASMSAAERTSQALSITGNLGLTGIAAANGMFNFSINGIAEEALTAGQTVAKSSLETAVGGAMIVAGGLQIASSAIQLGRAVSTEKDVKKARKTLDQKDQKTLTKDEKILSRFLKHQSADAKRQKAVGSLELVSGGINVAMGALMFTGLVGIPALAALGLVNIGISIAKLVTNTVMKKKNRRQAVDDFLQLDDKVKEIKQVALDNDPDAKINEKQLREEVRKEALAKLGYSSYMECYRFIVAQAAELLYDKNFVNVPQEESERQMYSSALDSVGLKRSKKKVEGEVQHPTAAEIYKKLLSTS